MIPLVLLIYGLIGFFTARYLIRLKFWKDLAVFGVLLVVALGLSVMLVMDIQIPNPFDAYNNLLEGLGLHY